FFFQAEDGIRVRTVTGVQTCALPISMRPYVRYVDSSRFIDMLANSVQPALEPLDPGVRSDPGVYPPAEVRARLVPERARPPEFRSEERRVGKERRARSRWLY